MKKIFLLFQKKDESIANYIRAFKELLDVTEQVRVTPGWYKARAKIAYKATGNDIKDWEMLKVSINNAKKKRVK